MSNTDPGASVERGGGQRPPNIVIIFCDDLGYGDLGCYGSEVNHTPKIDQMAAEGRRFTDFYVGQPLCSPSRAALLTGCYPKRVGLEKGGRFVVLLPGDAIGLSPDEITLPTLLKGAGYSTKIIGKWHLGDQAPFLPCKHGFDSHFGLAYSNDMRKLTDEIIREEALSPGQIERRGDYPPLPLLRDDEVSETEPDQASLTDRYTDEAIAYIRENKERPFFLYMAHMYVHIPLYTPAEYLERSQNGIYGAAVEHLDACTGRILDELQAQGIDEQTLVIFTSDNGAITRDGGSNAPLRGSKGGTWEGGMREPCIMRWPGTILAGTTCSELLAAMDLLPSLCGIAGIQPPQDRIIDGYDARPVIFGASGATSPREVLYYFGADNLKAVRSGRWKLHLDKDELYDLESDIGEANNLYGVESAVVAELLELAEAGRDDLGDALTGHVGKNCRPVGRVDHPVPLTMRETEHPYTKAEYD